MTQGLASVLVVYLLLVAVLALLSVAGVRLASAVRTGVVVAELMLVAEAVLAVGRMLGGDRPADPLVHLGYVVVSVVLLPVLLRPPKDVEGETAVDQRARHAVVALACLVTAVVVVRLRATA